MGWVGPRVDIWVYFGPILGLFWVYFGLMKRGDQGAPGCVEDITIDLERALDLLFTN